MMLQTEQEGVRIFISQTLDKLGYQPSSLLSMLWAIQQQYGYVSEYAMQCIGQALDIPPSRVFSVATFYQYILTKPAGKYIIRVSRDISSVMKGAMQIAAQLESDLGITFGETTSDGLFSLDWAGGIGMDDQAPSIMINTAVFSNLTPQDIPQILKLCKEALCAHVPLESRIGETVTNQLTYESHLAEDGLRRALLHSPNQIISEVSDSGLCGRGGAGFPTGKKWQMAANVESDTRYVICNADEGEPGTFKDRMILTRFADLVFEGMTIAGYALGAHEGIMYLRAEYAHMQPNLEIALQARREAGLLGNNILGKQGFNFDIRIQLGAGSYVCGEETALIESLEGHRGEPRDRPPYPVQVGFLGKPTVVNNVETFASVSVVLARGAEWFSSIGTQRSKGFKLFSVSGDCARPGVYEYPWGISIAELLDRVDGSDAKAIQLGGYSGRLIPASEFSRKLAYEDTGAGSTIIIYGHDRDLLAIAENYLTFFVDESCGQCTPCRDGNVVLLKGIRALLAGQCSDKQLEDLLALAESIHLASKCGLGQASPGILLAINRYFHDELIRHVTSDFHHQDVISSQFSEEA